MAATRGNNFPATAVDDLINAVKGKSSLAKLSGARPIPFNGLREMTFSLDNEVSIVAEGGAKSEGGLSLDTIIINPIKFEYGARVSDEFLFASEEEQLDILSSFNEGFAAKLAKGFDLAAIHGVNPKAGTASAVVGNNNFDSKVTTNVVTYNGSTPDTNIEDALALITAADGEANGIAMSGVFSTAMASLKANGVPQYPEFRFGGFPAQLGGMNVDVNNTINALSSKDRALLGDFARGFKWGYSKDISFEIIKYGDPDNSGSDLKGHNQVYLRCEAYLGWGILNPLWFAIIKTT